MTQPPITSFVDGEGHNALSCWFSLSYATFLTVPRVLMEAMPDEWQGKMAALLNEYNEAFPTSLTSGLAYRQPEMESLLNGQDGF